MKNIFGIFSAACLLSTLAIGQSNVEAKAMLQKASDELTSHKHVYLEFNYTFENTRVSPPIVQNEQGKIGVKGDDYHLEILGMKQLRNGNKVYTILMEDEEIQVTEYDPEEGAGLTPTAILKSFQKGYSYKLGGKEEIDGRTIEYVVLKPMASEEIDKIMVGIEKSTNRLYSLKQWGTNGTTTLFLITSYEPNKVLPANFFAFDAKLYPGFYIAD